MTAQAPTFDPIIHPPTRLQIMAALANVQSAEFALLRTLSDVSDSVLSKHLLALSAAGYVRLRKAALDGRQRTWVSMTSDGRRAFGRHVAALTQLAGMIDADSARVDYPIAMSPALNPD